jgi:hypothetical protein
MKQMNKSDDKCNSCNFINYNRLKQVRIRAGLDGRNSLLNQVGQVVSLKHHDLENGANRHKGFE